MAKLNPPPEDDKSTIYLALPRYVPTFGACMAAKEPAVTATREETGEWKLHVKLHRRDGSRVTAYLTFNPMGPRIVRGSDLYRWGIVKLGPGVWALSDSIDVEECDYHGYVVIQGVPDPAPWEQPLTLPAPPETS